MYRVCTMVLLLALGAGGPRSLCAQEALQDGRQFAREMVQADLDRLAPEGGGRLRVVWPDSRRAPSAVHGLRWSFEASGPEEVARAFMTGHPALTMVAPEALSLSRTERTKSRTVLHFTQSFQGLEVLGSKITVSLDQKSRVLSFTSSALPLDGLDDGTDIGRKAAVEAAREGAGIPVPSTAFTVGKAVFVHPGKATVVYRVVLSPLPPLSKLVCLVDASTGKVLKVTDEVRK